MKNRPGTSYMVIKAFRTLRVKANMHIIIYYHIPMTLVNMHYNNYEWDRSQLNSICTSRISLLFYTLILALYLGPDNGKPACSEI